MLTEQDWLQSEDPWEMFEALCSSWQMFETLFDCSQTSNRKFRLFACACCRLIWPLITDFRSRYAVETAERYVDGRCTVGYLKEAAKLANFEFSDQPANAAWSTTMKSAREGAQNAMRNTLVSNFTSGGYPNARGKNHAILLRDIFCYPFRPLTIDPAWLIWQKGTVVRLARLIYEENQFSSMPVLADALEDAGCTNSDILSHMRSQELHVKGCHVLDLLLWK